MKDRILKDIKDLKIQGATNVAIKSLEVIQNFIIQNKEKNILKFSIKLNELKDELNSLRKTEPMQYNVLNFVLKNINDFKDIDNLKKELLNRVKYAQNLIQINQKKINLFISNLIKQNMLIYTHCHSSTITKALIDAKKNDIDLSVNNTETRPLYQGRITAKELIKNKINVNHYVDSQIPLAIKDSDIIFLGCDSINPGYFFNKIGTNIVVEFGKKYDKPIYVVTNALKFDPRSFVGGLTQIEKRNPNEVWNEKNKLLNIVNNAFDKVSLENVLIISELGINDYSSFFILLHKKYPWMFD